MNDMRQNSVNKVHSSSSKEGTSAGSDELRERSEKRREKKGKCLDGRSNRKAIRFNSGTTISRHDLFRELNSKLQVLEKDTEVMKRTFFSCIEERAKLMTEIDRNFHLIKKCVVDSEARDTSQDKPSALNYQKERGEVIGLSEVLHTDSAPLLTQNLKVNMDISQDFFRAFQDRDSNELLEN